MRWLGLPGWGMFLGDRLYVSRGSRMADWCTHIAGVFSQWKTGKLPHWLIFSNGRDDRGGMVGSILELFFVFLLPTADAKR
jgi:hypothetical protein